MNADFGSTLRILRESRNLSQRDVEAACGISGPYLSQLETGKIRKPSPFFLHKLAALYGIGYELLMEKAGYLLPAKSRLKIPVRKSVLEAMNMTVDEEVALAQYLAFVRKNKKETTK